MSATVAQLVQSADAALTTGSPAAAERAVADLERALALAGPGAEPALRAALWSRLGTAYRRRRSDDPRRDLSRAIECYREVLAAWRPEFSPDAWGDNQYLLGLTHYERDAGPADIEAAISGFEAALSVRERDRVPEPWARAQGRLADALMARAAATDGDVEPAIARYRSALEVLSPASDPDHYSRFQRGLGLAYAGRLRGDHAENAERAIEHLQASLDAERVPLGRAMVLDALAQAYDRRVRGDPARNADAAVAALERALDEVPGGLPADVARRIELRLGSLLRDRWHGDITDDIERAIVHHERARDLAGDEPLARAEALTELGSDFNRRSRGDEAENLERAIAYLEAALVAIPAERAPLQWVHAQSALASTLRVRLRGRHADNVERAIASLEAAATAAPRDRVPALWGILQMNLGNAWAEHPAGDRADNLLRALGHYDAALEVLIPEQRPFDWANARLNQGITLRELAELDDDAERLGGAVACVEDALRVFTLDSAPQRWAAARRALGAILLQQARDVDAAGLDRAIACFEDALRMSARDRAPGTWADAHAALGIAWMARIAGDPDDNVERAIDHLQKALAVHTRDADPRQWAQTRRSLAAALARRGQAGSPDDVRAAVAMLDEVYDVACEQGMTELARGAAGALAELHGNLGDWRRSADALDRTLAASEDVYASSLLLRSRHAELRHAGERFALRAYAGLRCDEDARIGVELLERGRARTLAEALGSDRAELESLAAAHPEAVKRFRAAATAVRELDDVELEFTGAFGAGRADDGSWVQRREREEVQAALRGRVRAARQELAAAVQDLRRLAPADSPLTAAAFREIAAADPEAVLVYVAATRWGGVGLLVRDAMVDRLDLPRLEGDDVLEHVTRYTVAQTGQARDPAGFRTALDEVTRWAWEVAIEDLIGVVARDARVVLIPTGLLGLVPLHAAWVPDERTPSGRLYAMDHATFAYAPSALGLAEARRLAAAVSPSSMLAVDDPQPVSAAPLRLASDEAAAACAALGVPAHRLSGEEATAEAVAAALPEARTLHLACHAHSDPQHPWDSAVVMAHDEPLTLRSLQALRLRARLAVLSACETGHSSYRLLDEAIGMPSALLQAGVAGVIASLWRVSDEATMPLMVAFYDRLRADPQRPALALREAQRWLRDTTSGEKRESFERRLEHGGDGWPPRAVTEACYAAVALDDPDDLAHAAPADWAGFALIGA